MKKYVIIGNGVAACACIEGIRSVDPKGVIRVISKEPYAVYARPLISYYLEGKTDPEKMQYRPTDFYEENGCKVYYGKSADRIDPVSKKVHLDDGKEYVYTDLCIASGSSPFVPPFAGLETVEHKCSFMTLDDAFQLEQMIGKDSRVLIAGAGLIGLKCAEGIKDCVKDITVFDLADRVLSSILDETFADRVQQHLEANGIRFLLGDSAKEFRGNCAVMNSGKEVPFDVLVLSVGVRANTALVKEAGGAVNRGIVVDEKMQTSLDHVFAAGDCAEGRELTTGENRVLAILPNAYLQGYCAGVNMAGGQMQFANGIPMNSIGFFGLHVMTAGSYFTEEMGGTCYEEITDHSLRRLYTKDGYLTGFMLLGTNERAGIYTSMIRERVPLDTVDFDLLKAAATNAAFSETVIREKFAK